MNDIKTDENDIEKNIKNVKGTLFRWTADSADWYESASEYTGYHDRLTEIIAPHLDSEYTCCELACGTGTLARHLAPYVKSYAANDIDHNAAVHLADMISDGSCPNLDIIEGDWHDVFALKKFNVAVFSFSALSNRTGTLLPSLLQTGSSSYLQDRVPAK